MSNVSGGARDLFVVSGRVGGQRREVLLSEPVRADGHVFWKFGLLDVPDAGQVSFDRASGSWAAYLRAPLVPSPICVVGRRSCREAVDAVLVAATGSERS